VFYLFQSHLVNLNFAPNLYLEENVILQPIGIYSLPTNL